MQRSSFSAHNRVLSHMNYISPKKLKELDRLLIIELSKRVSKTALKVDTLALTIESPRELRKLTATLDKAGTFKIRCERHNWQDLDGERTTLTIARAASTDMWPMGTHYWVRDNAIIGARLLSSSNQKIAMQGKRVLLSALTFISSVSQLKRFEGIVRSQSEAFRTEAANWPYIFAAVSNNLNAAQIEGWAHKQDAWQILAWHVLEAIEQGRISLSELSAKQRRFLGLIIPFLAQIKFWKSENSGSWEEIPAIRSSVRAWEHRLIVKLAELSIRRGFSFIRREFLKQRAYLDRRYAALSLLEAVTFMEGRVIKEMISDLPHESPQYKPSDARYRRADGALIYLLKLDYPNFLASRIGRDSKWALQLEAQLLRAVLTLEDASSGGIARYQNDSYQRSGFFRYSTVSKLQELYGAPSGDASSHFVGRGRVVPRGRKAAWTHFVWQLAAWAGERYLATRVSRYRVLHNRFFKQGLALLTGKGEVSIEQDSKGALRVIALPPLRMPECWISDLGPKGRELIFPSPHTPLNWAVAEMSEAFRIRKAILGATERVALGS